MGFFDAEVAQPYKSLMYTYPEEDARIDADAANRARQFSAQSAAARGSRSARGPALNSYNRMMSDYTLGKAQQDRNNRLQYTNTMTGLMRSPGAVSPSTASTLGSVGGTVGGALLKEAAPDIWKRGKQAMGWDQTPDNAVAQYNAIPQLYAATTPNTMSDISGGYQPDYSPYAGLMSGYGDMPDLSAAYGAGDFASGSSGAFDAGGYTDMDPEVFSNLFDTGFIGW